MINTMRYKALVNIEIGYMLRNIHQVYVLKAGAEFGIIHVKYPYKENIVILTDIENDAGYCLSITTEILNNFCQKI